MLEPLTADELALAMAKNRENRFVFAVWLIFLRELDQFPSDLFEVETDLEALASQIDAPVPASAGWDVAQRTGKRLRGEIRALYGFREASVADADAPIEWPRDRAPRRRRGPARARRHPDAARFTWLATFAFLRARTLTDDLIDLLIKTVHRIGARAERKVERELLEDIKRVSGKQNLGRNSYKNRQVPP